MTPPFRARAVPSSLDHDPVLAAAVFPVLLGLALAACQAPSGTVPAPAAARSVILVIGDGVDDHQLTIARDYLLAGTGPFAFEAFPYRGAAMVSTVLEADPAMPDYVGDSASGGTAIATGVVTSRGRIATRAGTGEPIPTLVEMAATAGKRTGLVTTSSITDATPASFAAHIRLRYCEGPRDMWEGNGTPRCPEDLTANGGRGSIAEQLAGSGINVLLGGGYQRFAQRDDAGGTVLAAAAAAGYQLVRDAAHLRQLAPGAPKVLGLFGDSTLPVRWIGEQAQRAQVLRLAPDGHPVTPESFGCVDNPRFGTRPTLAAMTATALALLEPADAGFFLLVESASIDKQAHVGDPCGQIGETLALDEAVRAAIDYQGRHPDTLIVVASDHGHAPQIVPWPSLFASRVAETGQPQYPPGKLALVRTPEGGVLAVSYGTNALYSEEHTGTQIPVFAQGPGAAAVGGLIRQSDLFGIIARAMGLGSPG